MILRPRQRILVDRCYEALKKHGNTLAVAPTGAGKTVMLSALTQKLLNKSPKRAIILQHRDELTSQNRRTFQAVAPEIGQTGVVDANLKEWGRPVTFAMVPTLARNLEHLQRTDVAIIDEAHHSTAKTYRDILDRLYDLNPDLKLAGFTATAQRGDKTSLRDIYSNVADQITASELIKSGALIRPRFFVIDLGIQDDLKNVRETKADFDMAEVAKIMDRRPLNSQIVEHWKEKASDRQTVVFCSTVEHAEHVREAFAEAGVSARMVWGGMGAASRKQTLTEFDSCKFQVVINVAILTEGWSCQPVDCVVLLRPCSYKSTMIQMVGRGLRKLNAERYPGRTKNDCIVLDFGTSVLTHGEIEMNADLIPEAGKGDAPKKTCPGCDGEVPLGVLTCPLCGHVFEAAGLGDGAAAPDHQGEVEFTLREIDILNASPFSWENFFYGHVTIANGFNAWAMTIWFGDQWHSLGGATGQNIVHLMRGEKPLCISAADDFIREKEFENSAYKTRRWLSLPPTDNQLGHLGILRKQSYAMSRYRASCALAWKFNEKKIQKKLIGLGS